MDPRDGRARMEKDVNAIVGRWENCAAPSVMTKPQNGIQEFKKVSCENVVRPLVLAPGSSDEHTLGEETIVGGGENGAAPSVMTLYTRRVQKVKKVIGDKVGKSYVKGASVGSGWNGDTSSDVMTSATQQAPALQDMSTQTRPICGERERARKRERERERERGREGEEGDDCDTRVLNSGGPLSESESEWLETEVGSVSSVTAKQVRPVLEVLEGVMATRHSLGLDKECLSREYDWIKDKRSHDKWASEAAEKHQHVTSSDELMEVVDGSVKTAKVKSQGTNCFGQTDGKPSTTAVGK